MISRYDTTDYLKSEEDMAAYLDACLEEAPDDPAFIAEALGTVARAMNDQSSRDERVQRETIPVCPSLQRGGMV